MKTTLTVTTRAEARAIQAAMADPAMHAFVVITGVLAALPSDRARIRVLAYVSDLMSDHESYPVERPERPLRLTLADEPEPEVAAP